MISIQVNQAAVDRVDVDQAAVDRVDVDQAAVDGVDVDQAAVDGVDVDQAAVDRVDVDQAAVDQAAVDQAAVDQAAVDQAAVDRVDVDQAAVDQADKRFASCEEFVSFIREAKPFELRQISKWVFDHPEQFREFLLDSQKKHYDVCAYSIPLLTRKLVDWPSLSPEKETTRASPLLFSSCSNGSGLTFDFLFSSVLTTKFFANLNTGNLVSIFGALAVELDKRYHDRLVSILLDPAVFDATVFNDVYGADSNLSELIEAFPSDACSILRQARVFNFFREDCRLLLETGKLILGRDDSSSYESQKELRALFERRNISSMTRVSVSNYLTDERIKEIFETVLAPSSAKGPGSYR